MKIALVLQHVAFEDLGTLAAALTARGFTIHTQDAATAEFPLAEAAECDLLVVLGGPIGVYDAAEYPFLDGELECIRERLSARRPTLGICLGAQLMAAALGARVYPGQNGSEIGWLPLRPARNTPDWFRPLFDDGLRLLHWHGDTFDLPVGSLHLAETEAYSAQAFALGNYALALQFHPEVTARGLERWYVGHTAELHQKKIPVPALRAETALYAPRLELAAAAFWQRWLDQVFGR